MNLIPYVCDNFFSTRLDDIIQFAEFYGSTSFFQLAGSRFFAFFLFVKGVTISDFQAFAFLLFYLKGNEIMSNAVSS